MKQHSLIVATTLLACVLGGSSERPVGAAEGEPRSEREFRTDRSGKVLPVAPELSHRLGLSFPGSATRYYDVIADAGIGLVRLSVNWDRIEPTPGRYDWSGLDRRIITLQRLGVDVFLTLESASSWAATVDSRDRVKNATPNELSEWARFAGDVAERYDGDGDRDAPSLMRPVTYFQTANEWVHPSNPSGGWLGGTEGLIAFVNAAHDAVKTAHPGAVFVMGGVASTNLDILVNVLGLDAYPIQQYTNDGRLEVYDEPRWRELGVEDIIRTRVRPVLTEARYDLLDVHLYGPPARDAARIAAVRQLADRPDITVLSSECGGPSLDYRERYREPDHFFAVMERNLRLVANETPFCLWFRLGESAGATFGNRHTALYDTALEPKPGYYAFQLLSHLLADVTSIAYAPEDALHRFELSRDGQEPLTVVWRTDEQLLSSEQLAELDAGAPLILVTGTSGGGLVYVDDLASVPARGAWLAVIGDVPSVTAPH